MNKRQRLEAASFRFNFEAPDAGGSADSNGAGAAAGAGAGAGAGVAVPASAPSSLLPGGFTVLDRPELCAEAALVPPPASLAEVTADVGVSPWNPDGTVKAGSVVVVDWAASTESLLRVVVRGSDPVHMLKVPPAQLRLTPTARCEATRTLLGTTRRQEVLHLDTVFPDSDLAQARAVAGSAHSVVQFPLAVEPGLSSLVWPLSTQHFLSTVADRKVYVTHALPHRLDHMKDDFFDFNPEAMIADASRVVVWMKDVAGGKMQYLDAPPDIAAACYRAGHSLYFNPSVEVQSKWLLPLLEDLGLPADADDLPADIEVFAVSGRHATPAHFDAQENFTLQVRGTKRWTVAVPTAAHPVSNLHPASSNKTGLARDAKVLAACAGAPTVDMGAMHTTSFVLRPGSFMYLPAGTWHRVDAEDAGGSLSINFSVSGERWADFFARRLVPMLWQQDVGWRQRVVAPLPTDTAGTGAKAHLAELLHRLHTQLLPSLDVDEFLPPAGLDPVPTIVVPADASPPKLPDKFLEDVEGAPVRDALTASSAASVSRSAAWTVVVSPDAPQGHPGCASVTAHTGFGTEGHVSARTVHMVVPSTSLPGVRMFATLPPNRPMAVAKVPTVDATATTTFLQVMWWIGALKLVAAGK